MLVSVSGTHVMAVVADYSLPKVSDLHAYLSFEGWSQRREGLAGTLWIKDGRRVGVPFDSDADLIRGVVERVALAEGRTAKEIAGPARYLLLDVTHLRAATQA
jgi:hypothetical protein